MTTMGTVSVRMSSNKSSAKTCTVETVEPHDVRHLTRKCQVSAVIVIGIGSAGQTAIRVITDAGE